MTLIWTWMLCKRTCWTSLKVLQSVWLWLLIIIHVKQCLTDCKGLIGPLCLLSSQHSCRWGAGWFVITPTWCVRKLTLRQVKWLTQAYAIHRCQKWELNPGPRVLIHCLPSLPEKTAADRTSWEPAMTKAVAVMNPELWQETAVGGGGHENGVPCHVPSSKLLLPTLSKWGASNCVPWRAGNYTNQPSGSLGSIHPLPVTEYECHPLRILPAALRFGEARLLDPF